MEYLGEDSSLFWFHFSDSNEESLDLFPLHCIVGLMECYEGILWKCRALKFLCVNCMMALEFWVLRFGEVRPFFVLKIFSSIVLCFLPEICSVLQ